MNSVRYQFDEHVPKELAKALRQQGIEVRTSREAGLLSAPDPRYLVLGATEGWVLVTTDKDFLNPANVPAEHQGIIFYPQKARSM